MTLPLFDPPDFDRDALARRLRRLADRNIWVGASSWKYPGWLGQIYSRERYVWRGRFSQTKFEAECLAEYGTIFPAVCGDFSFYQFPAPAFWEKLFRSAPPQLRIALKVPEEVTCEKFPRQARYGARAGMENESYLNAELLRSNFLEPLAPYASRLGPLIFEFGARTAGAREFQARLEPLLEQLPDKFRYAVEVRNREYLQQRYFELLREHRIAHVLNAWTRMPPLSEQMRMEEIFPADFTVIRALLTPGRTYERAVATFQPYDKIREENPGAREALRALIRRMREERRSAYVFVNNRLEGNAPETIRAVTEE